MANGDSGPTFRSFILFQDHFNPALESLDGVFNATASVYHRSTYLQVGAAYLGGPPELDSDPGLVRVA